MAQPVKDSFLDLERHRQLLETNTEKLRKSLQHWQVWEAEYEGLKEEILAADPEPTFQQLITIGREYGGSLLTQDEVDDILGVKSGNLRGASQVTDLISKRIDYVQQNVKTLEKQLQAAENKLAAATVISTPDAMNEDGLPLTEILEELDDDGNVVSSRVSTPGSSRDQLLEVLKKAGVKDLKDIGSAASKESSSNSHDAPGTAEPKIQELVKETEANTAPSKVVKKGVKFAEDIKVATFKRDSRPNSRDSTSSETKKTVTFAEDQTEAKKNLAGVAEKEAVSEKQQLEDAKRIKDIMELAKEQNEPLPPDAVIPENESEEDAALRREMLQYGMADLGEVGAIVAELNLEENDSGFTDDDDYDDYDEDDDENYDSNMEDEEDEHGRSTGKLVSDEMHQQMRELEERLKARMMQNVGPNGALDEGIAKIAIKPDVEEKSPANGVKKGVRFAEKLDVSPAPGDSQSQDPESASKPAVPAKSPIGDIVERVPAPNGSSTTPAPTKKPSRFKSSRTTEPSVGTPVVKAGNDLKSSLQPPQSLPLMPIKTPSPFSAPIPIGFTPQIRTRTAPTGPANSTIGDIIEHEPSTEPDQHISEPDELDPELLNQEVVTEYHRMRNRMIQRQGGYLKDEEEPELDEDGYVSIPPMEEEGGPKKMSLFKAARLKRA